MIFYILLLLFGDIEYNKYVVVRQEVDTIEVNHVYDGNGKLRFDQVIFWNISKNKNQNYKSIVSYRIIKNKRIGLTEKEKKNIKEHWKKERIKLPENYNFSKYDGMLNLRKHHEIKRYRYIFHDGDVFREILSKGFKETWTNNDPEMDFRKKQPQKNRIELLNANRHTKH